MTRRGLPFVGQNPIKKHSSHLITTNFSPHQHMLAGEAIGWYTRRPQQHYGLPQGSQTNRVWHKETEKTLTFASTGKPEEMVFITNLTMHHNCCKPTCLPACPARNNYHRENCCHKLHLKIPELQ